MPIRKFRSVEEMNRPLWLTPGSPELYLAIRRVWDFGVRTSGRRYRPGVYRYRSFDEMKRSDARRTQQ